MEKVKLSSKTKLKKESPLRKNLKKTTLLKPKPTQRSLDFVSSGSWILNLACTDNINWGYPVGRVINAVGDYSVGKTLLACELVNALWYEYHLIQGKKVKIYYDEPEYAFDMDLAKRFNMPLEHVYGLRERLPNWKKTKDDFTHSRTVEDLYNNLLYITREESDKYDCILYVEDSLDAVSDAREIKHIEKKGVEKQDYGGGKGRVLSQMFRTCIQDVNNSNVLLFMISQIRANFGGGLFEPKYTRAGGKALDFYASIIYWIRECGKITTDNGFTQGIEAELMIDKNKIGSRYHKMKFSILHGYGIDNITSAVNFLCDTKGFERSGNYIVWGDGKKYFPKQLIDKASHEEDTEAILKDMLQSHWNFMVAESNKKVDTRRPKWGN